MKAAPFEYERPADMAAASKLLAQAGGAASVLAGGQSLVPMLNLRLARPDLIVDINGIEALGRIGDARDHVFIGALVRHAAVEDGAVPDVGRDILCSVAANIAYRGVRTRGTVGGSLAHADPAADWSSALMALGAEARVIGPGGDRTLPLEALITGAFTTVLEPGEILEGVRVPRLSRSARAAYYKFVRKRGEFAESIAAVVVDPERGVSRAVLGATHGAPVLVPEVAAAIAGAGGRDFAAAFDGAQARAAVERLGLGLDAAAVHIHGTVLSRAVKRAFAS
jgi:carbon-monoxide dehydrogenase medium subunit